MTQQIRTSIFLGNDEEPKCGHIFLPGQNIIDCIYPCVTVCTYIHILGVIMIELYVQ